MGAVEIERRAGCWGLAMHAQSFPRAIIRPNPVELNPAVPSIRSTVVISDTPAFRRELGKVDPGRGSGSSLQQRFLKWHIEKTKKGTFRNLDGLRPIRKREYRCVDS
jgi:hypothetical protein